MDAIKKPEDVASVDVHAAKDLLGSGHRYLDVRTTAEFKKGHVDKALNAPYMSIMQGGNIDFFLETICFSPVKSNSLTPVKTQFVLPFKSRKSEKNPEFLTQVASLCKKEDPSIVVCNSGGRALRACVDLRNAHVTKLEGGYSAWVDEGVPGDKPLEELKISCKFR
ncbi:protein HIGH ARSENIC CONTENT 1, mitochondrial [Citrus clementina]|uniref:protein HIGH ARSENIC CONTENT 1, mitochondrial n=1 Tax=Citrus clementina TaxID=85681 RepID=UPI000CED4031|nr:protein HIGH ARSENIC CONTENT 1, mitochondrial [Citrus x clementina]